MFYERLGTISKDIVLRAGTPGCTGVSARGVFATIDAGHVGRVAKVSGEVTFQQLSLMNGYVDASTDGGGGNLLVSAATTTLIDTTVAFGESHPSVNDRLPYGGGIHVDAGATLIVKGSSQIVGNRAYGTGAGGVFVATGATAVIRDQARIGFPIFGANTGRHGGGILAQGTVELRDNAKVSGNVSEIAGGGIWIDDGVVSLFNDTRIEHNTGHGTSEGGGIGMSGGALHTAGAVAIADNSADRGGGIYIQNGLLDLQGTTISGNIATGCGGGIYAGTVPVYLPAPEVYLTDALVDGNSARDCGGGIANLCGLFDADGATVISHNQAATDGGGLYQSGHETEADLDLVTFESNTAARGGGIAALDGTTVTTQRLTIAENVATTDGGGVLMDDAATKWAAFGGTDITDNSADRGGGVHIGAATLTAWRLDLVRNRATTEGGGARITVGSKVDISGGSAAANMAGTMGGGFAVPGGLLHLSGVDVLENAATTDGGGAAIANAGRVEATDTWFVRNTAGGRGGGIAVLSFAAMTDPQLMIGVHHNQEGCGTRGAIGKNEYCSDIRANTASGGGGGLYLEDGTVFVSRTVLRQNIAPVSAASIWMRAVTTGSPALGASNVLIANNGNAINVDSVRVMGGGFVGEAITSADNLGAPFRFGAGAPPSLLQRTIVWDLGNVVSSAPTALGATCTMFRGVTGATVGPNIVFGLDPMFVTTARGKYRLSAASANAVDQCTTGQPFDLDSDPRPVNVLYDRGAFEQQ